MPLESQDVNPEAASSTASSDVNQQTEASSTPATAAPAKAITSMEDALKAAFQKSAPQAEGEKEPELQEPSSEEQTQEPFDSTEQTDQQPEKKEGEEEGKDKEKGPIPFDRFNEVNTAKVQLETQLAEIKPRAEEYDSIVNFCQGNNISPDEYKYWLSVAAMAQSDPIKAVQLLAPRFNQLQAHTGKAWSAETKKAVDDGLITSEWADQITASQAKAQFQEEQAKRAQMQQYEQLRQQNLVQLQNSLSSWESQKKTSDPDFSPKKDPKSPDGKYEVFCKIFESQVKNAKSLQDILSTADQVYAQISETFKSFAPRPTSQRQVRSSQSTSTPPPPPKTLEEAIKQRLASNGVLATAR